MDVDRFELHAAMEDRHWWFLGRRHILQSLIHQLPPVGAGKRVVDAGCGTGGSVGALQADCATAGIDVSAPAIELAPRRFPTRSDGAHADRLPRRGRRRDDRVDVSTDLRHDHCGRPVEKQPARLSHAQSSGQPVWHSPPRPSVPTGSLPESNRRFSISSRVSIWLQAAAASRGPTDTPPCPRRATEIGVPREGLS